MPVATIRRVGGVATPPRDSGNRVRPPVLFPFTHSHPRYSPGMSPQQQHRPINLHLVSDSTGETLNSIARATLARFEDRQVVHHRWSLIRSRLQLDRVLEGLQHEPGPVLFTLDRKSVV